MHSEMHISYSHDVKWEPLWRLQAVNVCVFIQKMKWILFDVIRREFECCAAFSFYQYTLQYLGFLFQFLAFPLMFFHAQIQSIHT